MSSAKDVRKDGVQKNMALNKQKQKDTTSQLKFKLEKPSLFTYDERALRREVIFAISLYTGILLWIVCLKIGNAEMLKRNYINLTELTLEERFMWDIIPFHTRQNHELQRMEFIANSLIFAPYGVLLNYLFKKRNIFRDVFLCFAFSLSIEVFQLYSLLGGFATEDLIMNTLGYFVGLVFYYLIFKKRTQKTCIWVCRVANFMLLPVFIYALVTTLQNGELIVSILDRTCYSPHLHG